MNHLIQKDLDFIEGILNLINYKFHKDNRLKSEYIKLDIKLKEGKEFKLLNGNKTKT